MLTTPSIYHELGDLHYCQFFYLYESETPPTPEQVRSAIFANIPASTEPAPSKWKRYEKYERGWVAVASTLDRHWSLADASVIIQHQQYYKAIEIRANTGVQGCDKIAFGIDPRMTREDIEGATRIYKNETNTGWLFAHSNTGHHADHEIALVAGIDGIMQPFFRQYHVDVIMGANLTAKERAANQYKLLSIFYGECVGLARKNARTKHLGERHKDPHPAEGYIHSEIKVAYEATKTEWETNRAKDVALIQGAFTYITTALAIPNPETRWDKASRLAAEAKKKAEAEAEAQEQTNQESSGS